MLLIFVVGIWSENSEIVECFDNGFTIQNIKISRIKEFNDNWCYSRIKDNKVIA